MTPLHFLLPLLMLMGGCGALGLNSASDRAETENELPFQASLEVAEGNPEAFTVLVVASDDTPLEEFRESARFEATKYCLFTFGRSDANWDRDDTGDWAVQSQDGSPLVSGSCDPR